MKLLNAALGQDVSGFMVYFLNESSEKMILRDFFVDLRIMTEVIHTVINIERKCLIFKMVRHCFKKCLI